MFFFFIFEALTKPSLMLLELVMLIEKSSAREYEKEFI